MAKNYFAQYFLYSQEADDTVTKNDAILSVADLSNYDAWGLVRTWAASDKAAKSRFEEFARDPSPIKTKFTGEQMEKYGNHRIYLDTNVFESMEAINPKSKPQIGVYVLE